ncbi:flagella synthesis protein FlgN [Thiomicrospira microaerophila]|uniref:flagella synthesis protein FlgN n=1 Tax=Thiomicrospira microaerophila TaxID=406020 RepID=UPI0005CA3DE0|nr:flagellar export chaperone FlgN [Thiomicrospira microaerophila]
MSSNTTQNLTLNLEKLVDDLTQFKQLLQTEHELLQQSKLDELNALTDTKNQYQIELNTFTKALAADHPGVFLNKDSETITTQTDRHLMKTIDKLTRECFEINQQNGMILAALENVNTGLIHQLFQAPDNVSLYGASGKTRTSDFRKNLGKA